MKQRILVTGAAGFIGSHVCRRLLERRHEVVGIDNFDPFYERALKDEAISELADFDSFQFVTGDIRDQESLETCMDGVEAVIHLAARAGIRPSIEQPELYTSINVGGTTTLLETCRKLGVRRMVFGSSSSVYGDDTTVPFSEDAPCLNPISPYAATKRCGELVCRVYNHLHGFRIAAMRFFTVYGPRQRPDLAIHRFSRLMANGTPIPQFGDGSTERDYTWVDDIVQGVESGLNWTDDPSPAFEVFNLGESQTVRLDRLIELIGCALGVTPEIRRLPMMPGDVLRTCADVSKAREVLGYEPRVGIEEGIPRFVDWFERVRGRTSS